MQYMLLIYAAENAGPQYGTPEFEGFMKAYFTFTEETKANGVFVAGDALQPVNTATTLTVRDKQSNTTDGPFAETREVLGGYYILDCKDLDEALAYAAKIPTAEHGSIEVRPVMVFD